MDQDVQRIWFCNSVVREFLRYIETLRFMFQVLASEQSTGRRTIAYWGSNPNFTPQGES